MKRTGAAGILCSLFVVGSAVMSGCGGGSGSADTGGGDATRLVGFWSLTRTSGGLTGSGYPVTPGSEFLTFKANGTYTRTVNGQTTSGAYQVTNRTSFLYESDKKYPIITYNNTSGDKAFQTDVVSEVTARQLIVNEEAADGYTREYERTVQSN